MATVRINTSDFNWITRNAPLESDVIPYGTDTKGVMYFQVEVEVASVEHVKFAGAKMIRFDLADRPADHARPGAMYPESYLVSE
jgi:hypothetical protein